MDRSSCESPNRFPFSSTMRIIVLSINGPVAPGFRFGISIAQAPFSDDPYVVTERPPVGRSSASIRSRNSSGTWLPPIIQILSELRSAVFDLRVISRTAPLKNGVSIEAKPVAQWRALKLKCTAGVASKKRVLSVMCMQAACVTCTPLWGPDVPEEHNIAATVFVESPR
uniref:Uncharacterized protein n=1 Tax=Anopheles merus TaxID=30066 RepID=A0A182VF80_ANOME